MDDKELNKKVLDDSLTVWFRNNCLNNNYKDDNELLISDPFYRFIRIIKLIDQEIISDLKPGTRWIDLGCGPGNFASIISKLYNVDMTAADQWNLSSQVKETSFRYFEMDIAAKWDFDEMSFDVISALELLEHMIDTDLFLEKIHHILKKNGYLILSTPNINCLRNRLMVPFGKYPAFLENKNIIHHVRLYNLDILEKHLHEHGFKIISAIGISFFKEKYNKYSLFKNLSEKIANKLPQLCNNMAIIARKEI